MINDTVTIILKRKDAGIIEKALEEYQKTRNIKILDVRFGTNKIRMAFQDIRQKNKKK